MYVKLICDGTDISEAELFSKYGTRELSMKRHLLYKLCYERPMTINEIASLMYDKGFETSYENVRISIIKTTSLLKKNTDKDFNDFFNKCLEKAEKCC